MQVKFLAAAAMMLSTATAAQSPPAMTDAQIAHTAYTAGTIDIAAAKLALERSRSTEVRGFAEAMVRDHEAVNQQALELVKKLGVTPEANGTSNALAGQAEATRARLSSLTGDAFDRAYMANEIAYHRTVNGALRETLIPAARNGELKALLQTGLKLFSEHQGHAEMLAKKLR